MAAPDKPERASAKAATSKAAPKKAASSAKPAARKTKPVAEKDAGMNSAAKKSSAAKAKTRSISAEERYRMTEVAAYFMAERNNFSGNPVEYWQAAEAQISSMLSQP